MAFDSSSRPPLGVAPLWLQSKPNHMYTYPTLRYDGRIQLLFLTKHHYVCYMIRCGSKNGHKNKHVFRRD